MPLEKKQLLSRLHFFIFGATIVGETAITSLVVAGFGSGILGKLLLVNSLILFTLPLFFFKKIDSVNRGELLQKVLRIAPLLIFIIFLIYEVNSIAHSDSAKYILLLLYPISYLLKTVLFLTFWTMAADVSEPAETKSLFPRVASIGFMGGLSGALLSGALLMFLSADYILLFWVVLYVVAFIFVKHVIVEYNDKLIPKEVIPTTGARSIHSIVTDTKLVLQNILVRYIAILHYGIFITIFLVDFHFWHRCNEFFIGAGQLSQFQFLYYVGHSILTIVVLHYLTPDLIATRGFTRIFSYLPLTLFAGSVLYVATVMIFGTNKYTFTLLLLWQVFRYISFENFFSPIYQMFFAAVEKEKRGRAKTVIEGVVKPLAMMSASFIIMLIGKYTTTVVIVVSAISLLLVFAAMKIKHAYMQSLIEGSSSEDDEMQSLISNIGSESEKECISILKEFALFSSIDMKRLAIKLLIRMHRPESTVTLSELVYQKENVELTREVARYAGEISQSTPVIEYLVTHEDPVVWHRAVLSLVHHDSHLGEFREYLFRFFFTEDNPADQVHAGLYIWKKGSKGDKRWIMALLKSFLTSESEDKKELGVLGFIVLRLESWEEIALSSIAEIHENTKKIVVRAIIDDGSNETLYKLLSIISVTESETTRELLMREIYRQPENCVEAVDYFVRESNGLSIFCHRLIKALGFLRLGANRKEHFALKGIQAFAYRRLAEAYSWAGAYHVFLTENKGINTGAAGELLEIALHERLFSAAELALDTLVIQDETGFIAEGRRELRLAEEQEKVAIVELLEASKDTMLKDLAIPILEKFPWDVYYEIAREKTDVKFTLKTLFHSSNLYLQMTGIFWGYTIGEKRCKELDIIEELRYLRKSFNPAVMEMAEALFKLWETKMADESGTFRVLKRVLFLKKSELFSPVSAARLVRLAEGVHEVIYNEGDLISREGDRANHLYLIKEGSADIVSGSGADQVKFAEMNAGDAYGEVGLFNQDIRSASVIATARCKVYVLSRSYLKKMVSQIPELANTFLSVFGRKLQQSHDEVIRLQQLMISQEK